MTTLERMTLSRTDLEPDPRAQLAKEASAVLGYHKLKHVVNKSTTLAGTLLNLEIAPLNRVTVEAYKQKKAKPGLWSNTRDALCLFACVPIPAIAFACLLHKAIALPEGGWQFLSIIGAVLTGIATLVVGISGLVSLSDTSGNSRMEREWKQTAIADYPGAIPEFVLSKALEISRELPGVTFCIDQLYETEHRTPRRAPDPFLVATLGKEYFYVEVWDEKEYESKL